MNFYNSYDKKYPNSLQQMHYEQGIRLIKKLGLEKVESDFKNFSKAYEGALKFLTKKEEDFKSGTIRKMILKYVSENTEDDISEITNKELKKRALKLMTIEQSKQIFQDAIDQFKEVKESSGWNK